MVTIQKIVKHIKLLRKLIKFSEQFNVFPKHIKWARVHTSHRGGGHGQILDNAQSSVLFPVHLYLLGKT